MFKILDKILSVIFLQFIRVYQKTISPDSGALKFLFPQGVCCFYPRCSEYGYQAISKYGVAKGSALAAWRVCRCNPWSRGGYDPLL